MFILNIYTLDINPDTSEQISAVATYSYQTYKEALGKLYFEMNYATAFESRKKTTAVILDENGHVWKTEILE